MSTPSGTQCSGTSWARYFSETIDGDFEEAFGLCSCNHKLEARGEDRHEESEGSRNIAREKLVSGIRVIELRVELW